MNDTRKWESAGLGEQRFSPGEIAERVGLHPRTIAKEFRDRPGTLKLVGPKGRETLRIPASLVREWLSERSAGWKLL